MMFLTLGHPALSALARQLEEASRAGHWAQACAQWQTLRGEWQISGLDWQADSLRCITFIAWLLSVTAIAVWSRQKRVATGRSAHKSYRAG